MDASLDNNALFGTAAATLFKSLQEKGKELQDLKNFFVSSVPKFQTNYPVKTTFVRKQSCIPPSRGKWGASRSVPSKPSLPSTQMQLFPDKPGSL